MVTATRKPATFDEGVYRSIFHVTVDGLIVSDVESGVVAAANPAACRMLGYTPRELIGMPLASLIHPGSRPQFHQLIRTLRPGEQIDTWTRDVRKDGTSFYSRWRAGLLDYHGRRSLLWSIRDVSERMQAEQALRQRLRSRYREQSALLELSRTLASSLEFPPDLVLEQLREVIPYSRAALFIVEGEALVARAVRGAPDASPASPHITRPGPEILNSLLNAQKPIRVPDLSAETVQAALANSLLAGEGHFLIDGMRSWMWVPLAIQAGIIGGLALAHEKRAFFTPHYAELAVAVANQAVAMMVNADLYRNAQSAAAAQERQRLAQNLHDAVNQSLFSAGLIAEVLPRVWEDDPDQARQSLQDMRRLLRGAAAEMRALLAELRPTTITEADLGGLVRLLADAFSGKTNIPVSLEVKGEGLLPGDIQVAIYRICQEALNNIGKHAEAANVTLSLCNEHNGITVVVRDDGRGFDLAASLPGHFGLSMMRERAEAVGVLLSIESTPGHGTQVRMRWPAMPTTEDL